MRQDGNGRSMSDSEEGVASAGAQERHYMNKAYGRSLEQARALDERPRRGEFHRATIEPEAGGGHKVIVERSVTVVRGGRAGQRTNRSEHSFAKPEDALAFLRDTLRGRIPGEREMANQEDAEAAPETGETESGADGKAIEDVLGDILSGAGDRL